MEAGFDLNEYRLNAGMCVFNAQGLVFAAKRVKGNDNTWQMPQGGIDEGEDPFAAAVRELQEETSMSSVTLVAEAPDWLKYDFPPAVRAKMYGTWKDFKGQAQRWFLFEFTGRDDEVNLEVEHQEFSTWEWRPLEELPNLVVPFKRDVYEQVAKVFSPAIKSHLAGNS